MYRLILCAFSSNIDVKINWMINFYLMSLLKSKVDICLNELKFVDFLKPLQKLNAGEIIF